MDNHDRPSALAATPAGRRWSLGLMVLLLFVLFFQGCDSQGVVLTTGPVCPYFAFCYDSDAPIQSQLLYFSGGRAILNCAVLLGVFAVAPRWVPRLDRLYRSRRFQVAAMLVALMFNLILFAEGLWVNLVFTPIEWICQQIDAYVTVTDAWRQFTIAAVARGYFLACWAATYGLSCLVLVISERYLGFDRQRWWQFNLRLLLAVTFIVSTALGIAVRIGAS